MTEFQHTSYACSVTIWNPKKPTIMRSFTLVIALLLFSITSLFAQGWKAGIAGGTAAYLGDLQEDIWHQESLHPSIGIFGSYYFKDIIGLRGQLTIAHVAADDALANDAWRRQRNLSFRSDIYEAALLAEIDLTGMWPSLWIHPYAYIGVAGFYFNPQAQYNGQWHDLQPLGTEGQGTSIYPNRQPYSRFEMAFPLGAGLRFDVGRNWQVGVEVMYRKTFTDYLDDVSMTYPDMQVLRAENGDLAAALSDRTGEVVPDASTRQMGDQRGNAQAMDTYLTGSIVLIRRLGKNVKPDDVYGVQFGCPGKF